jgi:hypothetical protein
MTATPEAKRVAMAPETLEGLSKREAHVVRERLRGYDPYDTLMSPLFRVLLRSSKIFRFGAQQVVRRLGINLRPLLRVPKWDNPVTLGFVFEAASHLAHAKPDQAPLYRVEDALCPDGHFAYQLRRHRRITTPYMRWSSAYIYAGLARRASA